MSDLPLLEKELTAWRHSFHATPEFGFEEKDTAARIAATLRELGLDEVVEGVGGTGVVGTLRKGTSNRVVALRADMDALRISEQGSKSYKSTKPGIMHACGHDGHIAMLLGAAKLLTEDGDFDGTVRFIFQPAEEWGQGAVTMLDDGLMEKFPFDEIYGLHNMPGYPVGQFLTRPGAIMSAEDNFKITLRGRGGHASRPHTTNETMVAACALVTNLQTIVSRRLNPNAVAVVSVTEITTDGTRNALPGFSQILGDVRSFDTSVSASIEEQMRIISEGTALAHNLEVEVDYTNEFIPLINDAVITEEALAAARTVFGDGGVLISEEPITASEDFSHYLNHVPGCFAFIGNGEDSPPLHSPNYDFNDAALIGGSRFFTEVVQRRLGS